jgi:uncharacterized protein
LISTIFDCIPYRSSVVAVAPNENEPFGPVSPQGRIAAIDALRGIALFGVLAINLITEFRVSIFAQFLPATEAAPPVDRFVETVLMLAVDMKAFALFSFLFGIGLAIQFERLSASPHRRLLLMRRLIVLLIFGLLHLCLIWNGDILTEYAVAGLVVLPLLSGPRWLVACGVLAFFGLYLAMQTWPPEGLFPKFAAIHGDVAAANRIYPSGSFGEVLAFRLREIPLITPLHVFVFPRTMGLFLLGALAWRCDMLRKPRLRPLFSIAMGFIAMGAMLVLVSFGRSFGRGSIGLMAGPAGTTLLALEYAALIIAIANSKSGKALVGWAAPLGRMAFTNYIAQSLIFGWILYGYGLGMFGQLGAAKTLAIGAAVYAAQVFFSAWWLSRYRYGPVEWLWRTLMYGAWQPMSISSRTGDA